MIDLAAAVIEHQLGSDMEELDLSFLCVRETGEPLKEEERLIISLPDAGLTRLKILNLSHNPNWFKHAKAAEYLWEFI